MASKSTKNQWKWGPKSMQNLWKVEVASQMRFWSVSGCLRRKRTGSFWTPLATIFGQKSKKREKKWIRSSGTVPERSRNAKKTIFERLGKRLVFGMVFSVKMAYFLRPFSMKNHSKIHADFESEKVMIFHEKSMQTLFDFLQCFSIFWVRFLKVPNAK